MSEFCLPGYQVIVSFDSEHVNFLELPPGVDHSPFSSIICLTYIFYNSRSLQSISVQSFTIINKVYAIVVFVIIIEFGFKSIFI